MNKKIIKIDLSNFFNDERKNIMMLIHPSWKYVNCIRKRIQKIFALKKLEFVTSDGCMLLPDESIDIMKHVDTLKGFAPTTFKCNFDTLKSNNESESMQKSLISNKSVTKEIDIIKPSAPKNNMDSVDFTLNELFKTQALHKSKTELGKKSMNKESYFNKVLTSSTPNIKNQNSNKSSNKIMESMAKSSLNMSEDNSTDLKYENNVSITNPSRIRKRKHPQQSNKKCNKRQKELNNYIADNTTINDENVSTKSLSNIVFYTSLLEIRNKTEPRLFEIIKDNTQKKTMLEIQENIILPNIFKSLEPISSTKINSINVTNEIDEIDEKLEVTLITNMSLDEKKSLINESTETKQTSNNTFINDNSNINSNTDLSMTTEHIESVAKEEYIESVINEEEHIESKINDEENKENKEENLSQIINSIQNTNNSELNGSSIDLINIDSDSNDEDDGVINLCEDDNRRLPISELVPLSNSLTTLPNAGDDILFKFYMDSKNKELSDFVIAHCIYVNKRTKQINLKLLDCKPEQKKEILKKFAFNLDDSTNPSTIYIKQNEMINLRKCI